VADVLEVLDLSFGVDGTCHVEALVDDVVVVHPPTMEEPAEWGPAVCRGSFYFCDEDVIPATDAGLRRMFEDRIENWEVVDPSDLYDFGEDDAE
jgi:hypothetical protein